MLAIFLAVSRCLVDGGMAAALIQKRAVTATGATTVLFLNLTASLALAGLLFSTAGLIAWVYGQPLLQPMLQVLCLGPLIGALELVQQALFTRATQFNLQFRVVVFSASLGRLFGLGCVAFRLPKPREG